jgi:hypothetical protein
MKCASSWYVCTCGHPLEDFTYLTNQPDGSAQEWLRLTCHNCGKRWEVRKDV